MDSKANTVRDSVDSNSPLLPKPATSSSSKAQKPSQTQTPEQKAQAKKILNPEHPVSSIPINMKQW